MEKTKLAICMKDLEYQVRFVNCFMNHYKLQYELHVFTDLEQLKSTNPGEYAVIITGEYSTEEMANFVERGEIVLSLTEDISEGNDASSEKFVYTEKYQEVYKIAEVIERLAADMEPVESIAHKKGKYKTIGVFSLSQEVYQLSYAALLGQLYGEKQKVLLLDLQNYSGLIETDEEATMGLEDLLTVATTGNYSKGRLLECIRHEANWDYVYPVQNMQCQAEGTKELYKALIDILAQELEYQVIIINFGAMFFGQLEMMEMCQEFYLLSGKDTGGTWREESFFHELTRHGKDSLLQKIKRVEILPSVSKEATWKTLMEKWRWNHIGEMVHHEIEKGNKHGAVM